MEFYFCGKYIYTDSDEKEVERDMYAALLYFRGSNDHDGYEKWEPTWKFVQIFFLTPEQKCYYTQMKLAGEGYWLRKNSHINCRYWLVL